jgi:hypothetical protein
MYVSCKDGNHDPLTGVDSNYTRLTGATHRRGASNRAINSCEVLDATYALCLELIFLA